LQSWYSGSSEAKTTQPDYPDYSSLLPTHISDSLLLGDASRGDGGASGGHTEKKKDREDSISDLLFLYNITFLSDSKVREGICIEYVIEESYEFS